MQAALNYVVSINIINQHYGVCRKRASHYLSHFGMGLGHFYELLHSTSAMGV